MARNFEYAKYCPNRHENGNCLVIGGFCGSVPMEYCNLAKELTQYRHAEENGTLLRLPCKIGDPVYWLTPMRNEIVEMRAKVFQIDERGKTLLKAEPTNAATFLYPFFIDSDLNKKLFLTKEAAEQALKKDKQQ